MIKRFIPHPGDLIQVGFSQWYALKDGENLRVCEPGGWVEQGEEILVAPRHQVNTFWGPSFGPPDGILPMHMSTSGGPFKTLKVRELEGLELIAETEDTFWHWADVPRAGGGVNRLEKVALWRLPVLLDAHYQEMVDLGLPTHRDRAIQMAEATDDDETLPWED